MVILYQLILTTHTNWWLVRELKICQCKIKTRFNETAKPRNAHRSAFYGNCAVQVTRPLPLIFHWLVSSLVSRAVNELLGNYISVLFSQPGEGPILYKPVGEHKNLPRKDIFARPPKEGHTAEDERLFPRATNIRRPKKGLTLSLPKVINVKSPGILHHTVLRTWLLITY